MGEIIQFNVTITSGQRERDGNESAPPGGSLLTQPTNKARGSVGENKVKKEENPRRVQCNRH